MKTLISFLRLFKRSQMIENLCWLIYIEIIFQHFAFIWHCFINTVFHSTLIEIIFTEQNVLLQRYSISKHLISSVKRPGSLLLRFVCSLQQLLGKSYLLCPQCHCPYKLERHRLQSCSFSEIYTCFKKNDDLTKNSDTRPISISSYLSMSRMVLKQSLFISSFIYSSYCILKNQSKIGVRCSFSGLTGTTSYC